MAEERKNEASEEMTNEQIKMFLESIAIIVECSKDTKDAAKKIRDIKNNYNKQRKSVRRLSYQLNA